MRATGDETADVAQTAAELVIEKSLVKRSAAGRIRRVSKIFARYEKPVATGYRTS